nr:aspartyl-phosphate phosphatase Spo0E family protein [Heyndrickxia camelliae]
MLKDQLSNLIEKKRAELIEMVMIEGLHSPNTILYSQELDRLLNQYNEICVVKRTSNQLVANKGS